MKVLVACEYSGRVRRAFRELGHEVYSCDLLPADDGDWPKDQLDHINGVRDDNRIENLREVTSQQNNFNRKPNSNSTSNYKGVSW